MCQIVIFIVALLVIVQSVVAAGDLDGKKFKELVLNDDKVWLVEFYSSMCGGCQEFAPTWNKIANAVSKDNGNGKLNVGKINIDDKAGLKVAQDLGVLDDGVPHVRLFAKKGDNGIPVVTSESALEFGKIKNDINAHIAGMPKGSNNHVLKH